MEAEKELETPEALANLTNGYIEAVGGADNILEVDNCITRLRLTVKDSGAADSDKLKKLGAAGVVPVGKGALQLSLA
ncbi:glucose PTS transporter subunit EIIB [Shewanella sp. 10N.286.48.B5]|uniref:glucose PTS transporter subunit EIIB n=1 Tax=Shewanella sp. 10N.286.48.B5 TaxID=1880834 RepID=UPI0039A44321